MRRDCKLRQDLRPGEQVRSKSISFSHAMAKNLTCDRTYRSIVDELKPEAETGSTGASPECVSLAWSADGQTLYGGFTDNLVRVWSVIS